MPRRVLICTLLLAGCGGSDDAPTLLPAREERRQASNVELARCMRQHGIRDFDPQHQSQVEIARATGAGRSLPGIEPSPRFRRAARECASVPVETGAGEP